MLETKDECSSGNSFFVKYWARLVRLKSFERTKQLSTSPLYNIKNWRIRWGIQTHDTKCAFLEVKKTSYQIKRNITKSWLRITNNRTNKAWECLKKNYSSFFSSKLSKTNKSLLGFLRIDWKWQWQFHLKSEEKVTPGDRRGKTFFKKDPEEWGTAMGERLARVYNEVDDTALVNVLDNLREYFAFTVKDKIFRTLSVKTETFRLQF